MTVVTMPEFRQRTVLVTGAGSGIGAAVAIAFARHGAHVVLHYNQNRAGAETILARVTDAGGNGVVAQADLTDGSEAADRVCAAATEAFGAVDVLVNNAGDLGGRAEIANVTDEHFHRVMELNLGSAFRMCRAVVPDMCRRGTGAIVNVSSIAGRTGGAGGAVVYGAAKAAVGTLTRGLAREVGGHGVRVNAVSPGVIATPFHERHSTPERLATAAQGNPMERIGTPEDCVGPVLFLASEQMSGYVTGQVLEVNGGSYAP